MPKTSFFFLQPPNWSEAVELPSRTHCCASKKCSGTENCVSTILSDVGRCYDVVLLLHT